MCLTSVVYEFFQLFINIYYDHLVALRFIDFQLILYFISELDPLCFTM